MIPFFGYAMAALLIVALVSALARAWNMQGVRSADPKKVAVMWWSTEKVTCML